MNFSIKVAGMACTGCENRIKSALSTIDKIINVEADHTSGIVKVTSDGAIDISTVKTVIDDLGFEVQEETVS
ncbi:MAG: heavy metal-associated domain-containing protein [bacterium]|nr:heavy metal-associated domain-containing protein [bacterium]